MRIQLFTSCVDESNNDILKRSKDQNKGPQKKNKIKKRTRKKGAKRKGEKGKAIAVVAVIAGNPCCQKQTGQILH